MEIKTMHTPTKQEIADYLSELVFGMQMTEKQQDICNYVATAVNAHEELVKACRAALENWKADGTPEDQGLYELLQEALAKASGPGEERMKPPIPPKDIDLSTPEMKAAFGPPLAQRKGKQC